MARFRKLLYAKTHVDYEKEMETFLNDQKVQKYSKFQSHLNKSYFGRKEKWCMHVRISLKLPTNDNETNNLCESSFRVLKDQVFQRIRSYNLPDLTEMLLSDDHSYFKSKLIDVGNGRFSNAVHSRSAHQLSKCSYKEEDIVFICDQMYMVESQTQEETFYMVDMRLNHCDCPAGFNRGTCKHKIAVMKFFNCAELSVIPINDYRSRSFYHFLATEQHQDPSFYRELNQIEVPNDIEQYIEDHRANVYEDPAILEEVNQDDNDSENEGPILSDLEVESESDSDDENEI